MSNNDRVVATLCPVVTEHAGTTCARVVATRVAPCREQDAVRKLKAPCWRANVLHSHPPVAGRLHHSLKTFDNTCYFSMDAFASTNVRRSFGEASETALNTMLCHRGQLDEQRPVDMDKVLPVSSESGVRPLSYDAIPLGFNRSAWNIYVVYVLCPRDTTSGQHARRSGVT